jgi:hypothetical protein
MKGTPSCPPFMARLRPAVGNFHVSSSWMSPRRRPWSILRKVTVVIEMWTLLLSNLMQFYSNSGECHGTWSNSLWNLEGVKILIMNPWLRGKTQFIVLGSRSRYRYSGFRESMTSNDCIDGCRCHVDVDVDDVMSMSIAIHSAMIAITIARYEQRRPVLVNTTADSRLEPISTYTIPRLPRI